MKGKNLCSKENADRKIAKWIERYDGWFDFVQCSNCGHKEKTDDKSICPFCKAAMI